MATRESHMWRCALVVMFVWVVSTSFKYVRLGQVLVGPDLIVLPVACWNSTYGYEREGSKSKFG